MFRCFSNLKGLLLLAVATALAVYLFIWHGAHLAAALPVLLLLSCPFMHIFMHHGHGHGRRQQHGQDPQNAQGHDAPRPGPDTKTDD